MPEKLHPARILLIDDDENLLQLLKDVLTEEGYQVVGFSNFTAALAYLQDNKLDVVVVDLYLPSTDSTLVFKALSPYAMRIPIIIHTAFSSYETAKEALRAKFFSYVEKQPTPQQLIAEIRKAIRFKYQLEKEFLEKLVKEKTAKLTKEIQLRREKEYELRLNEEKYRLIVESIQDVILLVNLNKEIFFISPSVHMLTGYHPDEIPYDLIKQILPSSFLEKFDEFIQQDEKKNPSFQFREKITFIHKDGSLKHAEITIRRFLLHKRLLGFHVVVHDITKEVEAQQQIEDALRELSIMYDAISDYVMVFRADDLILYKVNKSGELFLRSFNPDVKDFIGLRFCESIRCINHYSTPEGCGFSSSCSNCSIRSFLLRITEDGIQEELHFKVETKAGFIEHFFMAFGKAIQIKEKRFLLMSLTDLTELRKKTNELALLSQRFSHLVQNVDEGYLLLQFPSNTVVFYNDKFLELFKVDESTIKKSPFSWLDKVIGTADELKAMLDALMQGERSLFHFQFQYLSDDTLKWFKVTGTRIENPVEKLVALVFTDVTYVYLQSLKEQDNLIHGAERERKRLARKIHDEINPLVSILVAQHSMMNNFVSSKGIDLYKKNAEYLQLLQKELYNLSHALVEVWDENFSFVDRMQDIVREFSVSSGISIQLNIDKEVSVFLIKRNFYVITLELLNNAMKYAEAKHIYINIEHRENYLFYHYKDDGRGFDLQAQIKSGKGLGLRHIRTHVEEMGGTLEFLTQPGQGVEVKIYVLDSLSNP